jgi:ParB-like chromosome segregation protein Spo0J
MTAITTQKTVIPYEELSLGEEVGFRNPRTSTGLDAKSIRELADSIEAQGLKDPLVVWVTEKDKVGQYVILRGQRRYLAIGLLISEKRGGGLDKGVPIRYATCADLNEAETEALTDLVHGQGISSVELAEAVERMVSRGMAQKDIAAKLNKSTTWVSRIGGAFKKASPELREAWKAGKVTDEVAKGIAEVAPEKQPEAIREFLDTRASGDRAAKAKARDKFADKVKKPGSRGALEKAVAKELDRASNGKHHKSEAPKRSPQEVADFLETLGKIEAAGFASQEVRAMRVALLWARGEISEKKLPPSFFEGMKAFNEAEAKRVRLGDEVRWRSQAGGNWTEKRGKVIEVVPAGKLPKAELPKSTENPREHESYVIETIDGKKYFPLPSTLTRLTGAKKEARS